MKLRLSLKKYGSNEDSSANPYGPESRRLFKMIVQNYDNFRAEPQGYTDGFIGVQRNGKWGFVNRRGEEVIPLMYDYVSPFHKGISVVKLNGRQRYINQEGQLVNEKGTVQKLCELCENAVTQDKNYCKEHLPHRWRMKKENDKRT